MVDDSKPKLMQVLRHTYFNRVIAKNVLQRRPFWNAGYNSMPFVH